MLLLNKQEQLNKLMATLHCTSPHFVRCIIPNENKLPGKKPIAGFPILRPRLFLIVGETTLTSTFPHDL